MISHNFHLELTGNFFSTRGTCTYFMYWKMVSASVVSSTSGGKKFFPELTGKIIFPVSSRLIIDFYSQEKDLNNSVSNRKVQNNPENFTTIFSQIATRH